MEHGDFYHLFRNFWWLIFPLFWMIGGMMQHWSRHARANRLLDMINAYAAQGKEPPPELVRALREGPDAADGRCRDGYRRRSHGWVPVFLFGALCAGFVMLALTEGAEIGDRHGLYFVAIIMGGLCLGFLVSRLSRRKRDELDPP